MSLQRSDLKDRMRRLVPQLRLAGPTNDMMKHDRLAQDSLASLAIYQQLT